MLHERITDDTVLVVDLDRTLITGDLAMEACVTQAKRGFVAMLTVLWAMIRDARG
jgi:hypothetical protein